MEERNLRQTEVSQIEAYEKPQIEIIEMEVDGNYLLSASIAMF